jgi:hypothetical protein
MRPPAGKAIVAGFMATTAMTLALYVLVSVLAGQPLRSSMLGGAVAWMPALVLQFVNGSITLPLIYVYVVFRFLPGEPWIRGALWGVILWCLTEILVMPLMQDARSGVASIGATAVLVFGLLVVFLVYGTLLGWLAVTELPRPVRLPEAERLAA